MGVEKLSQKLCMTLSYVHMCIQKYILNLTPGVKFTKVFFYVGTYHGAS
jgi:hypothetical protein